MVDRMEISRVLSEKLGIAGNECKEFGKLYDSTNSDCTDCQLDCEEYAIKCKELTVKHQDVEEIIIAKKSKKQKETIMTEQVTTNILEADANDIRDSMIGKKVKYTGKKSKNGVSEAIVLKKLKGSTGLLMESNVDGTISRFTASYKKIEVVL